MAHLRWSRCHAAGRASTAAGTRACDPHHLSGMKIDSAPRRHGLCVDWVMQDEVTALGRNLGEDARHERGDDEPRSERRRTTGYRWRER